MPKFTASDGAGFDDRRAYRKYEFELSYTFKKQRGSPDAPLELRKEPGAIEGQPFEMAELADCTVVLLDHSEAIQVDYLVNCRVFIGACCDSVFVRNCTGCTFTMACKQLRTRECVDCTFYLYTMTEPVIEMSNDVRFAPFNGAYPEHPSHMEEAGLDPSQNLWFAVFDFNDDAKTGKNWKLLAESEEEGVWCPGSDKAMATSTIPRVVAGSIPVPSEVEAAAKAAASGGGMQSFALGTSQADAEAAYAATAGEEEEVAAHPRRPHRSGRSERGSGGCRGGGEAQVRERDDRSRVGGSASAGGAGCRGEGGHGSGRGPGRARGGARRLQRRGGEGGGGSSSSSSRSGARKGPRGE
jgi:protein XRP2